MQVCDYCGVEIEGAPVRRKKHVYCSRTCAEEHEFESGGTDDEPEYEFEEAEDEESAE